MSAIPLVTGGFFSKDLILFQAWVYPSGGLHLFIAGIIGSFLTTVYSFRLLFIVFFGEAKRPVDTVKSRAAMISVAVLAVLSIMGGYIEIPRFLGNVTIFSDFVRSALPEASPVAAGTGRSIVFAVLSTLASAGGIYTAYVLFIRNRDQVQGMVNTGAGNIIHRFLFAGWGFDRVYDFLIVRPFVYLARRGRRDIFDLVYRGIELLCSALYGLVRTTQTGNVRWYAAAVAFGAIVFIGLVIFL